MSGMIVYFVHRWKSFGEYLIFNGSSLSNLNSIGLR